MKIQLWTDLDQLKKDKAYNLSLMKISGWHKAKGDSVQKIEQRVLMGYEIEYEKYLEYFDSLAPMSLPKFPYEHCDILYQSKIFSKEWTADNFYNSHATQVIRGGTGYDLRNKLPFDIEHQFPDYSLYGLDYAIGFTTRGCPNNCPFCICTRKEGNKSVEVAEVTEFWHNQRKIKLLDPNVLACKDRERILKKLSDTGAEIVFEQGLDARFVTDDAINLLKLCKINDFYAAWDLERFTEPVKRGLLKLRQAYPNKGDRDFKIYVLVNFNTDWRFDLERIEWLTKNGFDPYVMIYEKWKCHKKYNHLQRAVNNKILFRSLNTLRDYKPLEKYL